MTLESIVDLFGLSRGIHLVSRREEIRNSGTFKGVKTYSIELWDVGSHSIVVTASRICQITTENRETVIGEIEKELVSLMFSYYASK